ncbi:MAG: hypothetical protein ABSG17_00705 [Spirochaetia bacterium]|jgi:hypothetical protein
MKRKTQRQRTAEELVQTSQVETQPQVDQQQADGQPEVAPVAFPDTKQARKPWSAEARAKLAATLRAKYADPAMREKMREVGRKTWSNPELRAKLADKAKTLWTPEKKAKQAAKMREKLSTPEAKERMKAASKAYWDRIRSLKQQSEAASAK